MIKLTGMLLLISAGLLLGRGYAASLWDKARACREMEEAALLLASPGRVPFDVKSCLTLLCVSAFVLGRQKAVAFQQ